METADVLCFSGGRYWFPLLLGRRRPAHRAGRDHSPIVREAAGFDRRRAHGPSGTTSAEMTRNTWVGCVRAVESSGTGTYARVAALSDLLGDACEEEVPMADAARAAAQAVPISTRSSRRLFGEGGSRSSRMGRSEGRPGRGVRRPSKAVGPADSLVQVNRSHSVRFQKISRHHGSGRHAKSASARSIAPSRSSSTRSAWRSCVNETAPR